MNLSLGLVFAAALLVALWKMWKLPGRAVLEWMILFVGYGLLQALPRIDGFVWFQIEQEHPLFQPGFGIAATRLGGE